MDLLEGGKRLNILDVVDAEPVSVLDHVNDIMQRKEKVKEEKKNTLNDWGYMKKSEKTDEMKLQWKLLQHQNLYEKGSYNKIKKDEKMPDFFQVATLVNGNDKIKVGAGKESQSLHTPNRRKKKYLSALQMLERDEEMKKWCVKKYTKIQVEKNIGGRGRSLPCGKYKQQDGGETITSFIFPKVGGKCEEVALHRYLRHWLLIPLCMILLVLCAHSCLRDLRKNGNSFPKYNHVAFAVWRLRGISVAAPWRLRTGCTYLCKDQFGLSRICIEEEHFWGCSPYVSRILSMRRYSGEKLPRCAATPVRSCLDAPLLR
ncbi:rRNA-processing protein, putative [Plasmodium ovale wallikeri]|uniref:rRNA-processing protein, putative n=1 Tax=Plasmodium ovale wallikeri TaxID=864142 RepID=A0A1A9A3B1_PLAOA|nr:rRNA-processing protein, putative [Plasmodium ovale wallikeri]